MSGQHAQRTLVTESDPVAPGLAGVTRLDLVCSPQMAETAQGLARRWGEDRALPATAVDGIATLVRAAVGHGIRFGPKATTVALRWLDLDRVFIDVRWHRCSSTAVHFVEDGDVESTAAVFDALSEEWGFGTSGSGPSQWMVVDTR